MKKNKVSGLEIPEGMTIEQVIAAITVTSIDGRYAKDTDPFKLIASEFALMRGRVEFQILYLLKLSKTELLPELGFDQANKMKRIFLDFSLADFQRIKEFEVKTQHDLVAANMFVKEKLLQMEDIPHSELFAGLTHYCLTSADVDSTVRSKTFIKMKDIIIVEYYQILETFCRLANSHAESPMLGRTHGQPALPTTFGKEIAVFVGRLSREIDKLSNIKLQGKLGGAIGNMSAHNIASKDTAWRTFAHQFLRDEYDLEYVECTTQIEPYDSHAEMFHSFVRINNILINFCTDMWRYISDDWITQKVIGDEVGSSAMPQKVNPIKFENAEGNLELAVMLFTGLANNLTHSRLQRDLTDSTVVRNVCIPMSWTLIACKSLQSGLSRISPNTQLMHQVLMNHWEVLAEPIQTIMRGYGVVDAYDQLKKLTRGKEMTQEIILEFIENLTIPGISADVLVALKEELGTLSPDTYLGDAIEIARKT